MTTSSLPWWQIERYAVQTPLPKALGAEAGPHGVALVKAWPDGRTDQGWGLTGPKHDPENGFMQRYPKGEFSPRKVLYGYERGKWNFAFVMRSLSLVCIDIDGKNGGLEHAKRLGMLPRTLAETSKSGDGFHLFYRVEEEWSDEGFASLSDRIGIEQGVDIRAVGCVYHYPTQRWNGRDPVLLPEHLKELLQSRDRKQGAATERIAKILANHDDLEVLMLHDELLADLAKPIPQGKRNNTLFAIGQQMQEAQIPDWDVLLKDRAGQLGLPNDEGDKLVENIQRYAVKP